MTTKTTTATTTTTLTSPPPFPWTSVLASTGGNETEGVGEKQQQPPPPTEESEPLTASATWDSTNGDTAPATFLFETYPEGGTEPYTFSWEFGDGQESNEQFIEHTYQQPGTYTITLTVTDSAESTVSDTLQVTVRPATTTEEQPPTTTNVTTTPTDGGPTGTIVNYTTAMPDICPPNCLIIASPTDIQQVNIASIELTDTVNETLTVAGQSRQVPTIQSQLIIGTPEQIVSIALDEIRTTETNQTRIAEFEQFISQVGNATIEDPQDPQIDTQIGIQLKRTCEWTEEPDGTMTKSCETIQLTMTNYKHGPDAYCPPGEYVDNIAYDENGRIMTWQCIKLEPEPQPPDVQQHLDPQ